MKLVLSAAVLALLVAGCAANEPIEPNERLNTEYVTGSNLPRKSRPSEVNTYDQEAILIIRLCPDFQKIKVFPELLSSLKIDSMLFEIGLALVVVKLKTAHEYKLFFFYSFRKMDSMEGVF